MIPIFPDVGIAITHTSCSIVTDLMEVSTFMIPTGSNTNIISEVFSMIRRLLVIAFPGNVKVAVKGIIHGLLVSFALWFPIPANFSFQLPKSFAYALLLSVIFYIIYYILYKAKHIPPDDMGWKAIGMLLAGVIFQQIPLPETYHISTPPIAFLIIGFVLILEVILSSLVKMLRK